MVRGKFRFSSIREHAGYNGKELTFHAVTNDGTPENERFHRYTPSGTITMTVDNPIALTQFELGKCYFVDFNLVD